MNMNPGQGQDWKPVVLSKKPRGADASAEKNVRAVCTRKPCSKALAEAHFMCAMKLDNKQMKALNLTI